MDRFTQLQVMLIYVQNLYFPLWTELSYNHLVSQCKCLVQRN